MSRDVCDVSANYLLLAKPFVVDRTCFIRDVSEQFV